MSLTSTTQTTYLNKDKKKNANKKNVKELGLPCPNSYILIKYVKKEWWAKMVTHLPYAPRLLHPFL